MPLENKIHIFAPLCNILYICSAWFVTVFGKCVRLLVHASMKPGFLVRLPLCHKVSLPRCEARRRLFFLTCDIFGTGQTNILALCYLFGKTYKPAHSSAPQVTEINKLDQIIEKVIDVSTHIPLKRVSMGLTDRRKTAENLVDSRKS